jgi:DNA polymerase III subunit gamma/tau
MENFIVSARKYRPSTFTQVVGQQSITSTLQNAIRNNQVAQAFLFTGPRGVGKTTCARILAKTINCSNLTKDLEPCNTCESCTSFNNNASFNIHELDAASNNSVEDIRTLVERVRIPPQVGSYKVYIIDEVHMLSQAAFNAFLKTLEEPPPYAKFILATTEKHKILPTILSRCQIFDFRRISVEDISNYLAYVAENEHIKAEEEALHIIAQKSDGALRDALSTFDQIVSYSGDNLSYKNVIENLNILDYEYYFKMTDAMINKDIPQLLLIFNEIIENGFDGQHFISGLNEHLRNLLVIKDPATIELLLASPLLKERYKEQASACQVDLLLQALEICNQYDLSYKTSNNKRLHVEIALMQLGQLSANIESIPEKDNRPEPKKSIAKEQPSDYPAEKKKPIDQKTEPKTEIKPEPKKDKKPEPPPAQKTESKISPDENIHRVSNISIKDSLDALKRKHEPEADVKEVVIKTEFNQDQLLSVWKNFVDSYKSKSPSFSNAIGKYEPRLQKDFEIEYKVDNILIAKDVLNVTSLLEYLKRELKNNQIRLKPILPDKKETKVAYTDREKFEELAKKYPGIIKLKEQLNLELEF